MFQNKFTQTENFDDKPQDFQDYLNVINKVYELQGKKVNVDIPSAIASQIINMGYSLQQLKVAFDMMIDFRFYQLGLPEFLIYLRLVSPDKRETILCSKCGDDLARRGQFVSSGMLTAVHYFKNQFGKKIISDTKILCSCRHGQRLQKIWFDMPRLLNENDPVICVKNHWYFVFFRDDANYFKKMQELKNDLEFCEDENLSEFLDDKKKALTI